MALAPLDFPSSPTVGQLYPNPAVAGQPQYTWDGEKWSGGAGVGNVYMSDFPPAAPAGSLWFETDTGILYVRFNDGDSLQWLAIPGGPADAVRYGAQTLTPTEQTQARTNINAASRSTAVTVIRVKAFNASGTYTPDPYLVYGMIECVGGGGGGGGAQGSTGQVFGGGGGAGGGYSRKYFIPADVLPTKTVTVGAGGNGGSTPPAQGTAGGTSSVGSLCIAYGGNNGSGGGGAYGPAAGTAGALGTGDITATGEPGQTGCYGTANASTYSSFGGGGSSAWGGGGTPVTGSGVQSGNPGSGYGGGGSSGTVSNATSGAGGGGGTAGRVVITEYCSQ